MAVDTAATRALQYLQTRDTASVPQDLVVRRGSLPDRPVRAGKVTVDPEMFREIGTSGLRQYGGFNLEEWMVQLQGRHGAWAYREVMDNNPVVGAILWAIEWLARQVEYRVDKGKDAEAQELVQQCMHDMSSTWPDVVCEALSMLPYGWALLEPVYKLRRGEQRRPSLKEQELLEDASEQTSEDDSWPASSKYNDGKVGWRKMPVRAQETLLRWHFDGYSGLRAMEQLDWHGGSHSIPMQKALLFRCRPRRDNPEGYSVLRTAWTSYYNLKRIQNIEAIGIERDLAGIPVLTPPEGVDLFSEGNKALFNKAQEMVQSLRRDEYEGVVMPGYGWVLQLLSAGGSRQIATDPVVRRYEQRIATSMLADFVLIGQDAVGSYAMVDVKSDLFGMALDGILDLVCGIFNRFEIPRLLKLNGLDVSDPPTIAHASAGRLDLAKVGQFLEMLSMAGAPIPWSEQLMKELFTQAALPANFEDGKPLEASTDIHGMTPGDESPPKMPPPGALPAGPPAPGSGGPAAGGPPRPPEVQKADGRAVPLSLQLQERHMVLSSQLEADVRSSLARLGEDAAHAYMSHVGKATSARTIVNRIMKRLDVRKWVEERLMPVLRNHAGRVEIDTQRTVQRVLGREARILEEDAEQIAKEAGDGLAVSDIEPQVKEALARAISEGMDAGESTTQIADRIRKSVPAGRFVHAGAGYRAGLIAQDQTARMQRSSALALYRSHPNVDEILIRDGIYGPPRSDSECIARDGQSVPLADAESVHPYHVGCTLSFDPVVEQ